MYNPYDFYFKEAKKQLSWNPYDAYFIAKRYWLPENLIQRSAKNAYRLKMYYHDYSWALEIANDSNLWIQFVIESAIKLFDELVNKMQFENAKLIYHKYELCKYPWFSEKYKLIEILEK